MIILTARTPLPTSSPGVLDHNSQIRPHLTRSGPTRGNWAMRAAPARVRSTFHCRSQSPHHTRRTLAVTTQSLVVTKSRIRKTTTLNNKACIGGFGPYLPRMILRPAPMFCPAWEAPLFCPACRPMMVLPAFNCSSLKSRLASSAGLGPSLGPVHSGCL